MSLTVSTFYKFVRIDDREALRHWLLELASAHDVLGTILIAHEGLNATISGADSDVRAVLAGLRADARFADLESKESVSPDQPFRRLKVKVKPEIVTFGVPEADPSRRVGTYVQAEDWNALIARDDIVLIDTRNSYEVAIGTFDGARDPGTRAFSDFPAYVAANLDPARAPKVAMFCTGGIRCEKASAYLLGLGFPEVFHLKGGILKYLETVPPEQSQWRGECFVFDERVALGHGVAPGTHTLCRDCGAPVQSTGCCECRRTLSDRGL